MRHENFAYLPRENLEIDSQRGPKMDPKMDPKIEIMQGIMLDIMLGITL